RLLAQMHHPHMAGFGRGLFLPMPDQGPADLAVQMENDHDGIFLAQPHSGGRIYETGPLARMAWHPVVASLLGEFGPGLLARLTARLVEVASSLQEMAGLVQDLKSDPMPSACVVDGAGLGLVEAARGLLAHRVELEGGRVKRYQILAPTEWNFHPEGPLVRGLRGAAADSDLERRATLLVHALDPCVACHVVVENYA
ncbi:MAG: nickel-dependent hydrogenase large subunit, partial [Magnetospirillum sp.]|nr:nickel-dependent hydrogenase large subunit [Magnetospirillum sp.]